MSTNSCKPSHRKGCGRVVESFNNGTVRHASLAHHAFRARHAHHCPRDPGGYARALHNRLHLHVLLVCFQDVARIFGDILTRPVISLIVPVLTVLLVMLSMLISMVASVVGIV